MNTINRREFLRAAASVGASTVVADAAQLHTGSEAPPGRVRAWRTTKDEKFQPIEAPQWEAWTGLSPTGVHLEPGERYQEVLGFGCSFTDASCYLLHQMAPEARRALLSDLYGPAGLRFSVGRTCIGSSDYSTKMYSFDDSPEPDPELKQFSIEHDRAWILPTLREAREINPDLFLFSCVWSPPGWMKAGGSMLGGSMREHWFAPHAQYFVKFLQAYEAAGVKVQAVTVNNEVDTDQDGHFPATLWGQQYEIEFVGSHLGPLLESSGVPAKIWILDHNYNLWGRVMDELEDDQLRKYCNAVAWHGYAGTPDMMSRVQKAFPAVEMYWTEGGPDYKDPSYLTDWCKWGATFSAILRNGCRSITAWNLALDELGRPNIGPFSCGGVVTINSRTMEITRSGMYWALDHFSRIIRRGARRIDSQSAASDLQHVGLENPDGQQVMIVTNPGAAREIELRLGNRAARVSLKSNSVTTLAWR